MNEEGRELNEGGRKFFCIKKMNSFELCNDSEVYRSYVMDVLLFVRDKL